MKLKFFFILSIALFTNSLVIADTPNIKVVGQIPVTIQTKNDRNISSEKTIMLQKVILSSTAKNYLARHRDQKDIDDVNTTLPSRVQLGMNDLPVLDQGVHGTCVTFAASAAMDVVLQRGDYISQLCNLELGSYLASKDKFYLSGWDGSNALIVLKQIQKYGVISKEYQRINGCSGVYKYPADNPSTGKLMSIADFTNHSESIIPSFIDWKVIFNSEDAFTTKVDPKKILTEVKTSLAQGHRVIFSTLLDVSGIYAPIAGALGSYKTPNDTWILSDEIIQDFINNEINAGHEIIITGYDDQVSMKDPDGKMQKGIFIIRNSWGKNAGNQGDYYMTYSYFKLLAMDAQEIKS